MIEDDQVVEIFHQRENEYSLAGSIHKGRVTRVLPGMQSAFVDIGLERDAFLYVSDFFEDNDEYDKIVTSVEEKVLKLDRTCAIGPCCRQLRPLEAEPDQPPVPPSAPEAASPGAAPPISAAAGARRAHAPTATTVATAISADAVDAAAEGKRAEAERGAAARRPQRSAGIEVSIPHGRSAAARPEPRPRAAPKPHRSHAVTVRSAPVSTMPRREGFPGASRRIPGQVHGAAPSRRNRSRRRNAEAAPEPDASIFEAEDQAAEPENTPAVERWNRASRKPAPEPDRGDAVGTRSRAARGAAARIGRGG